jgi:hypothetical protein
LNLSAAVAHLSETQTSIAENINAEQACRKDCIGHGCIAGHWRGHRQASGDRRRGGGDYLQRIARKSKGSGSSRVPHTFAFVANVWVLRGKATGGLRYSLDK